MQLSYQQEFLCTVRPDIKVLLEEDWEEIEHSKALNKLDPDWDIYEVLEKRELLYIFTCRDEGKLVGYFVAVVTPNIHSKGSVIVTADVIFLSKPYRSGLFGYKLFKFSESCLREDGRKTLHVTTTERNPIDPIMGRLGYSKIETKFEKVL